MAGVAAAGVPPTGPGAAFTFMQRTAVVPGCGRSESNAQMTGSRYGLVAPRPQVARVLQICLLDQRLPAFATIDDALEHFTVLASA